MDHLNLKRYLSFSLGAEEYAIPLLSVREVIAMPEVTSTPYSPPYFLGIMNLRGQVISVIDLRLKLGVKPGASSETSVVILDFADHNIGVVVDSVNSVLHPKESELMEPPEIESSKNLDFILNVYRKEHELVLILDINRALSKEDKNHAAKAKAA